MADSDTGLASDDVCYFGNAIGEAGNSLTDEQVNAADELAARGNPRNIANLAPIDFLYDYNRDQQVNAADELIARGNGTNLASMLRLISVPATPGLAAAVPEPGTMLLAAMGVGGLMLTSMRCRLPPRSRPS